MLFMISCASGSTHSETVSNNGGQDDYYAEAVIAPADMPGLSERGFFMEVLPVPAKGQSFQESYEQAAEYAEFAPVWGQPSPFYDMAEAISGDWGKIFVEQYIRGNGMFPLLNISFIGADMSLASPQEISAATLNNQEWRTAYRQAVLDTVKTARPRYLSLGNEVNRWYEEYGSEDGDPQGFQHYLSLHGEVYDAVKSLSPETRVFCTFAREMVGQNREADMTVIEMFDPDKMDLLAWTSYPHAVRGINSPADIPDDYYSGPSSHLPGKPVAFTEAAWPALETFGGEQGQADFINELCGRLTAGAEVEVRLLGWPWLHDLSEEDRTGLISRDGIPRMAYAVWQDIYVYGAD